MISKNDKITLTVNNQTLTEKDYIRVFALPDGVSLDNDLTFVLVTHKDDKDGTYFDLYAEPYGTRSDNQCRIVHLPEIMTNYSDLIPLLFDEDLHYVEISGDKVTGFHHA